MLTATQTKNDLLVQNTSSPQIGDPGTGSSGIGGIETVVLKGNPDQAEVYTIMLRVPAHTCIAAHSHRDDRVATVISGTWHIGYGDRAGRTLAKRAMNPNPVMAATRTAGSLGFKPNSIALAAWAAATLRNAPRTNPGARSKAALRSTSERTSALCAPSATRMPISFVRCATR